jgi:hypothetical protein
MDKMDKMDKIEILETISADFLKWNKKPSTPIFRTLIMGTGIGRKAIIVNGIECQPIDWDKVMIPTKNMELAKKKEFSDFEKTMNPDLIICTPPRTQFKTLFFQKGTVYKDGVQKVQYKMGGENKTPPKT